MRLRMHWWFLLLPLLNGGCVTHALWTNGYLDDVNEPDISASPQLFEAKSHQDLLVVYREHSERSDQTRPRAYWLNQNEKRVAQNRQPYFVGTNQMRGLLPVTILPAPVAPGTNLPPSFYAVIQTNRQSFTLYAGESKIGSHDLPVYNDGKGKYERLALTPLAVTADLIIIGCVVGCIYLGGLADR